MKRKIMGAVIAVLLVTGFIFNFCVVSPILTEPATLGYSLCDDTEKEKKDVVGDIAKISIEAQEKAEVGELVRLNVSKSKAENFKWLLVPDATDFVVYNKGRMAVFSARKSGRYSFTVACAYKDTVDVVTHILIVEGGPVPDPIKVPAIPKPIEGASLIEWIPYWCSQSKKPKDETLRLAGSFESIAAQISAGVLSETKEIINVTSKANREALAGSVVGWLPVLQNIQNELKERASTGVLETTEQHATTWREIARGLKDYAALLGV